MSQFIQHPATSIRLSFAARKAAWLLALVVLVAVAATAVVLLVSNGSDSSSAAAQPSTSSPALRYDGGPEEGTAGVTSNIPVGTVHRPYRGGGFNERYDGGPEEGPAGR